MEESNLLLRMESRNLKPIEIESFASSLCSNPRVEFLELVSLPPTLVEVEADLFPPPNIPLLNAPGICGRADCISAKKNKVATILNIDYN